MPGFATSFAPRRAGARSLLPVLAALLLALPAGAQEQPAPAPRVDVAGRVSATHADFTGRVVNARTGAPVPDAIVRLPGLHRQTVTDSAGRFRIPRVPAREHRVLVSAMGYADMTQAADVRMARQAEIALPPQPVVLERINVIGDMFRTARRRNPHAVRAIEREELLRTRMFSARNLLPMVGVDVLQCGMRYCVWHRGKYAYPSVQIDGRPAIGGLDELDMYAPQDLYVVEVMFGGRMITAYTTDYVERMARRGLRPAPLVL